METLADQRWHGRLTVYACALVLAMESGALMHAGRAQRSPSAATLVVSGASVIDLATGAVAPATIVIENGRITSVSPPDQTLDTPGASRVDATGQYVIPGLWDMHAHTTYANAREVERAFFGPLVAHGVVHIRDPASRFAIDQLRRWRVAIEAGTLVGPQIVAIGRVLDARPVTIGTVIARDHVGARRAAERVKREGFDFVKPYNHLTEDSSLALAAQARQLKIPIAGHLPYAVDAVTAAAMGQRSIEHLTNIWFETADAEDQIRARLMSGVAKGESPVDLFRAKIDVLFPLALRTHNADKEQALLEAFVRHRTWHTPTLVVDRHFLRCGPTTSRDETRLIPLAARQRSTTRLVPGRPELRGVRHAGHAVPP